MHALMQHDVDLRELAAHVAQLQREIARLQRRGRSPRVAVQYACAALLLLSPTLGHALVIPTGDIAPTEPIDAAAMVDRFDAIAAAVTALEERPVAQLVALPQTFVADTWTPVIFSGTTVTRNGILVNGTDITLPRAGVYRITLTMRFGGVGTSDDWTGVRLSSGGEILGASAGFQSQAPSNPATVSFLAEVTDEAAAHTIEIGRLFTPFSPQAPTPIDGTALPSIQVTVEYTVP